MPQQTYLIYTDLDGTLLDHDNYSFSAALPTLIALLEKGHFVMPNTSKTASELIEFRRQVPLDTPFIVENGAAVYVPLDFYPTPPSGTEIKGNYWRKTFCKERGYWLTLLNEYAKDFAHLYTGFSEMSVADIAELTSLSEADAALAARREFGEPLLWKGNDQQLTQFTQVMKQAGASILQGGRFVHVCGSCDKGSALTWLSGWFAQISTDTEFTTVALGDSGNDTAMLEKADIAIQIKAHGRPFPKINKKQNLYQSTLYGPEGWAEILSSLILHRPSGGVTHG